MKDEDAQRMWVNVPTELLHYPQWVAWRLIFDGKREIKPPFNINSRKRLDYAKSNDPDIWGRFDDAVNYALDHKLHGVGFVFSVSRIRSLA